MDIREEFAPFDLLEIMGRKVLCFSGKQYERGVIPEGKVHIILNAILRGWDVSIDDAVIKGGLSIHDFAYGLVEDDEGNRNIKSDISIRDSEICGGVDLCKHLLDYVDVGRDDSVGLVLNGGLDFSNTIFDGTANFSGAIITKRADFAGARFCSGASFDGAFFNEDADFGGVTFGGYTYFGGTTFNQEAYFHSASFLRAANLEKAELDKLSPDSLEAIGLAYRRSYLLGANCFFEQAGELYLAQEPSGYSKASESFRNAKVEYEKEGDYRAAGKMYIKEMDSIRKDQKTSMGKRFFLYPLWKILCNYGEAPWQLAAWIIGIILLFAIIYSPYIGFWPPSWASIEFREYPYHEGNNFLTALYFSVVTFATLGFGDIFPVNGAGRIYVIIEVLLGYLMFGMLITFVARKMTRS